MSKKGLSALVAGAAGALYLLYRRKYATPSAKVIATADKLLGELGADGITVFSLKGLDDAERAQLWRRMMTALGQRSMPCNWRDPYKGCDQFYVFKWGWTSLFSMWHGLNFYYVRDIGSKGYILPHREAFATRSPKYIIFGGLGGIEGLKGGANIMFKSVDFTAAEIASLGALAEEKFVPLHGQDLHGVEDSEVGSLLNSEGYYGKTDVTIEGLPKPPANAQPPTLGKRLKQKLFRLLMGGALGQDEGKEGETKTVWSHGLFHKGKLQIFYHMGFGFEPFYEVFDNFIHKYQLNLKPAGTKVASQFSHNHAGLHPSKAKKLAELKAAYPKEWARFMELLAAKMETHSKMYLKEDEFVLFDNDIFTHSRAAYEGEYGGKKVCAFWLPNTSPFHGFI